MSKEWGLFVSFNSSLARYQMKSIELVEKELVVKIIAINSVVGCTWL